MDVAEHPDLGWVGDVNQMRPMPEYLKRFSFRTLVGHYERGPESTDPRYFAGGAARPVVFQSAITKRPRIGLVGHKLRRSQR